MSMGSPPGISHKQDLVSPAVLRTEQCIILRRRPFSCAVAPRNVVEIGTGPVSRSDMCTPGSVPSGQSPKKDACDVQHRKGIQTETLGGERRAESSLSLLFARGTTYPSQPCLMTGSESGKHVRRDQFPFAPNASKAMSSRVHQSSGSCSGRTGRKQVSRGNAGLGIVRKRGRGWFGNNCSSPCSEYGLALTRGD